MLGAFQPQGIFRWHQTGFQRVVAVNHRRVDIVEGARICGDSISVIFRCFGFSTISFGVAVVVAGSVNLGSSL